MSLERWSASGLVLLDGLPPTQTQFIRLIRMWTTGTDGKNAVWTLLANRLGTPRARVALRAMEQSVSLIDRCGPRPLTLRPSDDDLVNQDEHLFATLGEEALSPDREHALLLAMLLVRPDLAPALVDHMTQLSLHIRCMELPAPDRRTPRTLH
ncbi:hypothetical protein [Tropicimonas sp. S265A]|uniref:hypothetical protein n=1 Tax=Tropicimonas sp. S265A TaxID=3415134 RepID=UPI003C7C518B